MLKAADAMRSLASQEPTQAQLTAPQRTIVPQSAANAYRTQTSQIFG